jgi:RNA polymerase sigma-70 factor, ECF subfamily
LSGEVHQIVEDCLRGHPAGMSRLMRRFQGQVFGLCLRMLGQWQDAEDAAQDTFVRVSRSLSRWDATRSFEPWLLAIAANRCRTVIKRRTREISTESLADDLPTQTQLDQVEQARQFREELDSALAKLPDDWAKALRLFHVDGLAYQEIASRMGCPVGTIKTWIHRGRRMLLDELRQRGFGVEVGR